MKQVCLSLDLELGFGPNFLKAFVEERSNFLAKRLAADVYITHLNQVTNWL